MQRQSDAVSATTAAKTDRRIKMVRRDDPRRLIFASALDMHDYIKDLTEKRKEIAMTAAKLESDASRMCTAERRRQLKRDGFTKFSGGIPKRVVNEALREINREIDLINDHREFKARRFAKHPSIKALITESMAPYICAELLGGTPDDYRAQIGAGQLALRFPCDMCQGNDCSCSPSHFDRRARMAYRWVSQ